MDGKDAAPGRGAAAAAVGGGGSGRVLETTVGGVRFFPRLQMALDAYDESVRQDHTTRCWCRDLRTCDGSKEFCTAPDDLFYSYYSRLAAEERFFYEIIRDDTPCALFLDIDIDRNLNPDVDFSSLVRGIVRHIRETFAEAYDPQSYVLPEDSFLVLDSSSGKKHSAHIVARPRLIAGIASGADNSSQPPDISISSGSQSRMSVPVLQSGATAEVEPPAAWANIHRVRTFVGRVYEHIIEADPDPALYSCRKMFRGRYVERPVIDFLIYTPFRAFRLWQSSKRRPVVEWNTRRFLVLSPLLPNEGRTTTGASGSDSETGNLSASTDIMWQKRPGMCVDGTNLATDSSRALFMLALIGRMEKDVDILPLLPEDGDLADAGAA